MLMNFQGNSGNVTRFTSTLGYIDNLPIAHVLYAFDKDGVTVVLREHNNIIYMGYDMIDSLSNPIKCQDNDGRVKLRPKLQYPNNNNAQLITFPDGTSIPVDYDGVLPCIAVCKPNKYKVENCERIALTSKIDEGPYGKG